MSKRQVFAGLIWEMSEGFEIYGGARYISIDDPSFDDILGGVSPDVERDDVLIELGLRFNF